MFRVTGNDGHVYGLVDTAEKADKIVRMRRTGRNGAAISNPSNGTKASSMDYKIENVSKSEHPGYR